LSQPYFWNQRIPLNKVRLDDDFQTHFVPKKINRMARNITVGVDIGTYQIKVVVAEKAVMMIAPPQKFLVRALLSHEDCGTAISSILVK
jgi:hypothetical protein